MIHGDLLGERTKLSPDRTALVTVADDARYTYHELNQRAVPGVDVGVIQQRTGATHRIGQ